MAYTFDNPLRKLLHNPEKILGPYIEPGFFTVDMGCGMGHFSLGMARLVGQSGRVFAVDLQEKMLDRVKSRAGRAGLDTIIETRKCSRDSINVSEPVDFILACWMAHEVRDRAGMFKQFFQIARPGASLLVVEPKFHVTEKELDETVNIAESVGFELVDRPNIRLSYSALLKSKK
jgi:ubiquinone/menaquinone biosynthesis C-methylase UbiE